VSARRDEAVRWSGRRFRDRREAGSALAAALQGRVGAEALIVGLARGGVPVAAVVADAVGADLVVLCPRKVVHPNQPEFARAAVCGDGPLVAGPAVAGDGEGDGAAERDGAVPGWFGDAVARARDESLRRGERFGSAWLSAGLAGRTVVVIDDGVATGLTLRAALAAVRAAGAAWVVAAVPVAPREALPQLARDADEVVVVWVPEPFPAAVGYAYERFDQVDEAEVMGLLRAAQRRSRA